MKGPCSPLLGASSATVCAATTAAFLIHTTQGDEWHTSQDLIEMVKR